MFLPWNGRKWTYINLTDQIIKLFIISIVNWTTNWLLRTTAGMDDEGEQKTKGLRNIMLVNPAHFLQSPL